VARRAATGRMGGDASFVKAVEVPTEPRNHSVMPRDPFLVDRARAVRRNMGDAEKKLWFRLRRRKIAGHRFRRQVPVGDYIVDFACLSARLIIEVDGGRHHNREAQLLDETRTASLEARGYRVVRFWNSRVLSDIDGVVDDLQRSSSSDRPPPGAARHPPPRGRGDLTTTCRPAAQLRTPFRPGSSGPSPRNLGR